MRLDIFLKQTGLVKRRTVAKAMCDGGKIDRNGKAARASDEIRRHDILRINYGFRTTEVEILEVPVAVVSKIARTDFYRVIKEERDETEVRQRASPQNEPLF